MRFARHFVLSLLALNSCAVKPNHPEPTTFQPRLMSSGVLCETKDQLVETITTNDAPQGCYFFEVIGGDPLYVEVMLLPPEIIHGETYSIFKVKLGPKTKPLYSYNISI